MNILSYECEMAKCHDELQKAKAELARLTAYIEQEKFNWQLDRERADGAEERLADHKVDFFIRRHI